MAILSNINGKFAVDSTGAIQFSGAAGTADYVLVSGGAGAAPTWVDVDTIIGGPYLPLTGGTLAGAGNLVVGGTLTVNGIGTFNTPAGGVAFNLDAAADNYGTFRLRTNGNANKWDIGMKNDNDFYIYNQATSAQAFEIDTANNNATFSGNVGIGAAPVGNPGTKILAVGTAGTTAGGIQLWAANNQAHYLQFGDANSGGEVYRGGIGYNHSSETLLFLQNSSTALSFTGSQAATFAGTVTTTDVYGASSLRVAALGGILYLDSGSSSSIILRTNGTTTALTLDSSQNATFAGNVFARRGSFGTASNFNFDLYCNGNAYINDELTVDDNATFAGNVDVNGTLKLDTNGILQFGANTATPSMGVAIHRSAADTLNFVTASTNRLTIDSSGNSTFAGNVNAPSVLANGFMEIRSDTASLYFENAANNNYYRLKRSSNDFVIDYYNGSTTSDRLTIDSSGNVGIGITTPTLVAGKIVHIHGTAAGVHLTDTASGTANSDGGYVAFDNPNLYIQNKEAGFMSFETSATERMRIDQNGDISMTEGLAIQKMLTIGTNQTSGRSLLTIRNYDASLVNTGDLLSELLFTGRYYSGSSSQLTTAGINLIKENADGYGYGGALAFDTGGGSEKMRITSVGELLKGITSAAGQGTLADFNSSEMGNGYINLCRDDTATIKQIRFGKNGSEVGSISTTGSATAFNTSSDYRLKENVIEMTNALDRVSQLKPSRFNFIADADKKVDGFLAHEVQEIVPEAISGEKDAVDEEGNPEYQGIDQSKLVPLLVGAIKELEARVKELENK